MPSATTTKKVAAAIPVNTEVAEAVMPGVMALAGLFSNCVEAFNLIHAAHDWDRPEQLLLCRLGLQQARLLIWGDVVGISSPPATVTDRAVPKHPSSHYPDLSEPTFFGARDDRLEETDIRTSIEASLSAIVDRSSTTTREEMMARYGLRPPKRLNNDHYQPALDPTRLEAFRERYELLQEVAETHANLMSSRRNASVVHTPWNIADNHRFSAFIELAKSSVDTLVDLMDVAERVDRGMRMDIRTIGWHLAPDRVRVGHDRTKLRLLHEACKTEYPRYIDSIEIALANVEREWNDFTPVFSPTITSLPSKSPRASVSAASTTTKSASTSTSATTDDKSQRRASHGLFGGIFKGLRGKGTPEARHRSASVAFAESSVPARSHSDSGPANVKPDEAENLSPLAPVRSKSVGALFHPTPSDDDDRDENGGGTAHNSDRAVLNTIPEASSVDHTTTNIENATNGMSNLSLQNNGNSAAHKHFAANDDENLAPDEMPGGEDLSRVDTADTVILPLEGTSPVLNTISRHDQYHGIGRQGTKNQ